MSFEVIDFRVDEFMLRIFYHYISDSNGCGKVHTANTLNFNPVLYYFYLIIQILAHLGFKATVAFNTRSNEVNLCVQLCI